MAQSMQAQFRRIQGLENKIQDGGRTNAEQTRLVASKEDEDTDGRENALVPSPGT